jgi:transaldolase
MSRIDDLKVRLFMDGAEIDAIRKTIANSPYVAGFTTNPTLMRKAGVKDYEAFAIEAIGIVGQRSISFEVFADDFAEMEREAHIIHSWGGNTYVKIPVTNTEGDSAAPLIRKLSAAGVPLNVTAILTHEQIRAVAEALDPKTPSIVSVFAGRIADTGVDPVPMMREAKTMLRDRPKAELLWASCRELLNIIHADMAGCDIITIPNDILSKLPLLGHDLKAYSLETVRMFFDDALAAGFRLR